MKTILQKIKDFLNKGKYTTNDNAADIIRRLVDNTFTYPLQWDDFETQNEDNPEANLALELVFFFAKKFPGNKTALCCNEKAFPYLLKVADTLEEGKFKELDYGSIIESLRRELMPAKMKSILNIHNDLGQ